MSVNKKKIAQYHQKQKDAEKAAQKDKNAKLAAKISIAVAICAALAVVVVGVILGIRNSKVYYADITIENYGTITVELDRSAAPITVDNFISLAESGFYDGLTFHRIMEGFMMQGGDPEADGTGGSDQTIKGEFKENGWDNPISHTRGTISMARSNPYDSASSQFFIMHEDYTGLDGKYAAFGRVISGIEIVDAICTEAKPSDDNGSIPRKMQPVIESIVIREG
ncbi:MAG: peptidylprolyl isomerase [Oscillospiraceae bacterium]|nr:peptidylprolyl isomerase [Oscillospiraceae bacterium]